MTYYRNTHTGQILTDEEWAIEYQRIINDPRFQSVVVDIKTTGKDHFNDYVKSGLLVKVEEDKNIRMEGL